MIVGVIPARIGSTRLAGKLLADLAGKPVLQHTWERACVAGSLDRLLISAGDEVIANAARAFGADVVEVFDDVPSGSDRVFQAVRKLGGLTDDDIVLNIQGDEPFLNPSHIDGVVARLLNECNAGVSTPVTPLRSYYEYMDQSAVKCVMDSAGYALYFSRAPIPSGWQEGNPLGFRHLGLYCFRYGILETFVRLPQTDLEKSERLEQLRLLHNGIPIATIIVESGGVGIDTAEDLEQARRLMAGNGV